MCLFLCHMYSACVTHIFNVFPPFARPCRVCAECVCGVSRYFSRFPTGCKLFKCVNFSLDKFGGPEKDRENFSTLRAIQPSGERDLAGGGGGYALLRFFQKWHKNFFAHLHHSHLAHLAHLVRFCIEKKREENFSALRAVQPVEKET